MADTLLLTKQGIQELEERLDYLERVRRLEIAEDIKEARALGDLSENAEYDAAKDEQAAIESEIVELKYKLAHAVVIDEDKISTKTVSVGCLVKLLDIAENEEIEYRIVGTTEADIANNKISNESPIGRAVIGKKKNEVFTVSAPMGKCEYKVLAIKL